jgi:D-beta-D-heptose 7-phosphate kinase/D-beta-D-heptose 1-phosphate adenosyltransferase
VSEDTTELISLLDRWQPRRVLVAGDFMLDHYTYGNADRLSPDAPVPVLSTEREQATAGGAANVVQNLRALRCEVSLLGVIGDDQAGEQLRALLDEDHDAAEGLVRVPGRPTTVKHNYVGLAQHRHPQKMFRADVEDSSPIDAATVDALLQQAAAALPGAEVLCLEDYNKGVLSADTCQRLIALARQHNVPVLVDPAAIDDFTKYRGATCLTPNRTEAERATGGRYDGSPEALGQALMDQLELEALVLTLDKQGALLLRAGCEPLRVPTVARSVYDVTGAGDQVLAMLAAARANDADWPDAVALANTAAGLEVERFGVVPIELEQVLLALLNQHHQTLGKARTQAQLLPELSAYRSQGKRIAFTNGCFDILHAGHVQFLRQAREQADLLVVGLNSDASIQRIKGADRPVNQEADRILVLSELASVDYIVVFDEDTPLSLIEAIQPDVLVKGTDYTRDQVVGADVVESRGGRVALVDLVEGRSTSNIIRRMQNTG